MELNKKFWNNKKVFLSGHTGFKGSWLSLWLHKLNANVYGYSLKPSTSPSLFDSLGLNNKISSKIGDIRNYDTVKKSIDEFKPEILIHMAAQPLVRDSYLNPVFTYETNVMGTVNILEVARNTNSIKSILVITSDKCYHNLEKNYHYKESDSLGGYDPYSSSKGCADIVSSAYYNSYFSNQEVGLSIARAGNVIGGGDWSKDRIIPDAMRAFSERRDLIVRNPQSIRPWQFVLDPLSGYLKLIEELSSHPANYSGPWNFGPKKEDSETVKYICDSIVSLWGHNAKWVSQENETLHEASLLQLDSKKAYESLSWSPKYDLNTTLEKTIKWYTNYYSKNIDLMKYTLNQIDDFLGKNNGK